MLSLLSSLVTAGLLAVLPQVTVSGPVVDPAVRPGIYADTASGYVRLTTFLETRQDSGSFAPVTFGQYVVPPGFAPQAIDLPRRFVVNSSDAAAEQSLKVSTLRLHVTEGATGAKPASGQAQMSKRVFRLGVNLFEITSAELSPDWLRKTVGKLAREKAIQSPALFLEFQARSSDGLAPRLYVVQIAL